METKTPAGFEEGQAEKKDTHHNRGSEQYDLRLPGPSKGCKMDAWPEWCRVQIGWMVLDGSSFFFGEFIGLIRFCPFMEMEFCNPWRERCFSPRPWPIDLNGPLKRSQSGRRGRSTVLFGGLDSKRVHIHCAPRSAPLQRSFYPTWFCQIEPHKFAW